MPLSRTMNQIPACRAATKPRITAATRIKFCPSLAEPTAACPLPLAQRPVSFVQVPPPGHALVPVLQSVGPQGAPGVVPPTHRFGSRSPSRKS